MNPLQGSRGVHNKLSHNYLHNVNSFYIILCTGVLSVKFFVNFPRTKLRSVQFQTSCCCSFPPRLTWAPTWAPTWAHSKPCQHRLWSLRPSRSPPEASWGSVRGRVIFWPASSTRWTWDEAGIFLKYDSRACDLSCDSRACDWSTPKTINP